MTQRGVSADAKQRIRALAAEQALAEAEALILELHQQLDRANRATVRMAQCAYRAAARRAA